MRKLICTLFFVCTTAFSQNYELVDKIVLDYPSYSSLETLSKRIETDFKTEAGKARAAFTWIANNINYDIEIYGKPRALNIIMYFSEEGYKRELRKRSKQKAKTTLLTKKALCGGFSSLFYELCSLLNLESVIIRGISKVDPSQINSFKTTKNHAWNAVKVNGQWQLLDVTWASGFIEPFSGKWIKDFDDFYYDTKPEHFITSHYPEFGKWQLLDSSISLTSFYEKPIFYSHYYKSDLKLSKKHNGNIKVTDNEITLFFDEKNKKDRLYYTFSGDKHVKHLKVKKTNENLYQVSIDYKNKSSDILTLYLNFNPILDFTIN